MPQPARRFFGVGLVGTVLSIAIAMVMFKCTTGGTPSGSGTVSTGRNADGTLTEEEKDSIAFEHAVDIVQEQTRENCGSTYSLISGDAAKSGNYAVSAYPEAGRGATMDRIPDRLAVRDFMKRNLELLKAPGNSVGTYCERVNGDCHKGTGLLTCYLDITRQVPDLPRAAKLATACNQKSVAYLAKDGVAIIDSYEGHGFGNGHELTAPAMAACRAARGD